MRPTNSIYLTKPQLVILVIFLLTLLSLIIFILWSIIYGRNTISDSQQQAKQVAESAITMNIANVGTKEFYVAEKIAIETQEIDISGCKSVPKVAKMTANYDLTLKNNDQSPHTITFNLPREKKSFIISPKSSLKISTIFYVGQKIPLVHGFTCDNSPLSIGAILLSAPKDSDLNKRP